MNTIAQLVTITREMRSIEDTLMTARRGLRKVLERQWQAHMDARGRIALEQLRRGTDAELMRWICQDADDRQLQDLYCDWTEGDAHLLAMAARMR